jgi:tetratricopeptide (TPR) repeat protein
MSRKELGAWVAIGGAALALRLVYVAAQPAVDPMYARPMLDEAVYVGWARGLASGAGQPPGAFYLAPLYPNLLALWVAAGAHFGALYAAQQALAVASAGALAWTARRLAGPPAGIAAGVLSLTYHPALFFASRPLGETVAVALLAFALAAGSGVRGPGLVSGLLSGAAALARPNLAPTTLVWAAGWPRRGVLLLGGAALAIVPAAARNWAASGHLVAISSNGGITLYQGNGPGALGIFTPASGLSGRLDRQREEATRAASAAAGRRLDPVEADAWWGRQALRVRAADPLGSAVLLVRRAGLLVSTREIGLDAAPALDANPWRWAAPLPFACLLGLTVAGVAAVGFSRTGGWLVWGAVVPCAVTPLLFYVSSRYRLPLASTLAVPGGIGLAALLRRGGERRGRAVAAGLAAAAVSVLVPSQALARACLASGLSNRSVAWMAAGDMERASADLERALALDGSAAATWFNAGVLAERRGDPAGAERAYRQALAREPASSDAAGNLGGLLVRTGRPGEATEVLERAVAADPTHAACWANLVVALLSSGRPAAAREAAARATAAGIRLDPGLTAAVAAGGAS